MSERTAAQIRDALAPGQSEAQLVHVDGTVLSPWLTSPEAFDAALEAALQQYPREQIRIRYEEAVA